MITSDDAAEILEAAISRGAQLVVAGHADLRSVKQLLEHCLKSDIPAVLGPCNSGG